MPAEKTPEQRTIAQLNDEFRRSGRDVFITSGVQALPDVPGLLVAVQQFNTFTPDNDPYGEHDFGSIVWHREKDVLENRLLRCHACNTGMTRSSPDCRRILTVLLASEY